MVLYKFVRFHYINHWKLRLICKNKMIKVFFNFYTYPQITSNQNDNTELTKCSKSSIKGRVWQKVVEGMESKLRKN